jgi:hypothetical protein
LIEIKSFPDSTGFPSGSQQLEFFAGLVFGSVLAAPSEFVQMSYENTSIVEHEMFLYTL